MRVLSRFSGESGTKKLLIRGRYRPLIRPQLKYQVLTRIAKVYVGETDITHVKRNALHIEPTTDYNTLIGI